MENAKVCVIGDGANGKTCLINRLTGTAIDFDYEAGEYEPTTFSNFLIPVDDEDRALEVWDTAGQEGFEQLRTLSYPGTQLFVITYSCISDISLSNVEAKWWPEITSPKSMAEDGGTPWVILCGTKCDLYDAANKDHASPDRALAIAKELNVCAHIVTSAKTEEGTDDLWSLMCSITAQDRDSRPNFGDFSFEDDEVAPETTAAAAPAAAAAAPAAAEVRDRQTLDDMFDFEPIQDISGKWALVTGSSSGIGKATACQLAKAGCNLVLVARREEKLQEIADAITARGLPVEVQLAVGDVCSDELYKKLEDLGILDRLDFLINNAGLARGKERAHEALLSDWDEMMNANCNGAFRMVRTVLPGMIARKSGHIISTGSIAGLESYEGGTVYCASKHALHAFMKALRYETYIHNVRTTVVAPGFVGAGTEFSETRFHGDTEKAKAVYTKMQELSAADVAGSILFTLRQPAHVNLDLVHIMPTCQGGATRIHRE